MKSKFDSCVISRNGNVNWTNWTEIQTAESRVDTTNTKGYAKETYEQLIVRRQKIKS